MSPALALIAGLIWSAYPPVAPGEAPDSAPDSETSVSAEQTEPVTEDTPETSPAAEGDAGAETEATTRPAGDEETADAGPTTRPAGVTGEAGEDLQANRTALEELVKVRKLISEERQESRRKQEMLRERIELIQQEIDSIQAEIEQAQDSIRQANEKRSELVETNDRLKALSTQLGEAVGGFEARTKALLPRLPAPLREFEGIARLSQGIPDDPENAELSLSRRFEKVIGILTKVNEWHNKITTEAEVLELPDGRQVHVTSLYLGVSHGYYIGAENTVAGVGHSTKDGWGWEPADEAASIIARAIAILDNEESAAFVQLPVEIK